MLGPWVPLIALALLFALSYGLGPGFLAAVGGVLLALALLSEAAARLGSGSVGFRLGFWKARRERKNALKRAKHLDWSVIDNSMSGRPKRDCERPETLGICTGLECLVYKTCDFNIKKPLP
ncbi:MAG: hypothetical protein ACREKE_02935 [bacterium]